MPAQFIPGQYKPAGWDVNNDGQVDVTMREVVAARNRTRGQEVRTLNQYTGYFSTEEGDYPVSVVANSIKEAAKILSMPGVFGQDCQEPSMIKYVKGMVAVSVPVHNVGFNTYITPAGAIDSGAYATPVHSEVQNGTDVIFTAFEPFGWKFVGWYKGDPDNGGQLISTKLQSTIDVYDPYSTLVDYYAKFEFAPELRNGRYMDVARGWIFDIKFDGYSNYKGRVVIDADKMSNYYFRMTELSTREDGSGTMILEPDETIQQPEAINATIAFVPSYIGLNMVVSNITTNNMLGFVNDDVINLKWIGEIR